MDSGTVRQYDIGKMEAEPTYIDELFHQMDIPREHCIPCIVVAYGASANTVDVQPLPNHTRDNGTSIEEIPRPELKSIPVLHFAHGGFEIKAPLFVGDTGYVIAADRNCHELIEKNKTQLYADDADHELNEGAGIPDDYSLAQFASGFFVPCSWATSEQDDDEKGALVIKGIGKASSDDKWQRIILKNDGTITIEVADRKLTVGSDGIVFDGKTEAKLSLIADLQYDVGSHQIQVRRVSAEKSGNVIVNVGDVGDWEMITGGQAVPVSENN